MFSKLSLKTKLISAFGALSLILLLVGGVSYAVLQDVSKKFEHIAKNNLPNTRYLSLMKSAQYEIRYSINRLGVAGLPAADRAKVIAAIPGMIAAYEKSEKDYLEIPFEPGEKELYSVVEAKMKTYVDLCKRMTGLMEGGTTEGRKQFEEIILNQFAGVANDVKDATTNLISFQVKNSTEWQTLATSAAAFGTTLSLCLVGAGFLLALVLGFLIASSISKTLGRIASSISNSSEQVGSASMQLSSASQQLSSGATEAASSLEETVSSIEELSSMVKLNADHAREASTLSATSRSSAEKGESEITQLITAMTDISQSSKKIEEIINVIDDIAFQTNLLALNAAVEAARAGEQGKGFAVVAEAVRNLAQRSAGAAKEIATLIKDSVSKIERGSKIADNSGSVLKEIVLSVKKVADLNNEIASASQEQSNGLTQISKAMNQMDQATQGNAASAEEAAASSDEMSAQAQTLRALVGELQELVEGHGDGNRQSRYVNGPGARGGGTRHDTVVPLRRSEKSRGKNVAAHQSAEATIPFDSAPTSKVGNLNGF